MHRFLPFFQEDEQEHAVVCIDPSDPDNLRLLVAVIRWFGPEHVSLLLTGRAAMDPRVLAFRSAKIKAEKGNDANLIKEIPLTDWDPLFSEILLQASALRIKKLLAQFDCPDFPVYHGGIAPKAGVPHALHINDFTGFGDITPDEEASLRNNAVHITSPAKLAEKLVGKPFVIFLGGPATGAHALLQSYPELTEHVRGMFAQYAMLDGIEGMQWEGRAAGAQFNVMLDPVAGKKLCHTLLEHHIPVFFLPTNVTRDPKIGFGVPATHASAFYTTPGLQELARLHQVWYEAAIRSRKDELILEHDFATLLLFLQLTGHAPDVYEYTRMHITDFATEGPDAGVIRFAKATVSSLWVATKLLNPEAYVTMLRMSVVTHTYRFKHVVICGSIEDDASARARAVFEQRVLETVEAYLRQGHVVHWGSHPSMRTAMQHLARQYPSQIHQYLLEQYGYSHLPEIPYAQIRVFDTLTDMRIAMLAGRDVGIFLSGRNDFATTESKMPGVLAEFFGFRLLSPTGMVVSLTPAQDTVPLLNGAMESLGLFIALAAKYPVLAKACADLLQAAARTAQR